MKALNWYNGASILLHALLILTLVDISFSAKNERAYDIYEVDLLASEPSTGRDAASGSIQDTENFSDEDPEELPTTLSGVEKENILPEIEPEVNPSQIEPPGDYPQKPEQDSPPVPESDVASYNPAPADGIQGRAGSQESSSHLIALWKMQVKGAVENILTAPPEILLECTNPKTTYLIRVSRDGELIDKRLLVSSGNKVFDISVKHALNSINNLPRPPLGMIAGQESVEVTMTFTLSKGLH